MQTITATFEDGVLKPSLPLHLPVNSEVRLTIDLLSPPKLTVARLRAFAHSLPKLEDDSQVFHRDLRSLREEFSVEAPAWE